MSLMEEFDPSTNEQGTTVSDYGSDNDEDCRSLCSKGGSETGTKRARPEKLAEELLDPSQEMDMSTG